MNQTQWTQHKLRNLIQSMLLMIALSSILGLLGWILGGFAISLGVIAGVILIYWLNPVIAPQLLLRMYQARPIDPHEAPQLYELLQTLTQRAELERIPVLYYLPSNVMNAFATGSQQQPIIGVSNGLLQRMNLTELAGVLAHEISHLRHNDIRVMTFADMTTRLTHALSLIGQFLLIVSLPFVILGGYSFNWLVILILLFAPGVSALLQLALSRAREFDADLGAAELLGTSQPLASALAKMEHYQGRWLEHVLLPSRRLPEPSLLRTHPPTHERIQRLQELQNQPVLPSLQPLIVMPTDLPQLTSHSAMHPSHHFIRGIWY